MIVESDSKIVAWHGKGVKMQDRKYVLIPGWVLNDDGKNHRYVDEKTLLDAFNVSKEECVVSIRGTNESIQQLINKYGLIALTPRGKKWATKERAK